MNNLIDKEETLYRMREIMPEFGDSEWYEYAEIDDIIDLVESLYNVVQNADEFEVNQIPGAKWMQVGTDIYECSNCNARLYGATVERLVDTEHFCYSCGSKMEVHHDEN